MLTSIFFMFTAPAATEVYTLSLHDALPIWRCYCPREPRRGCRPIPASTGRSDGRSRSRRERPSLDRKSTRLNSSHPSISYAVFCLKKKKDRQPRTSYVQYVCEQLSSAPRSL